MDNHQASVPIFRLKVSLRCCAACPKKAEKKLNKIHGVKFVTIDKEEGMVIVSGNVDPKILTDKFAKWGRKAQLLSFQNQKDSSSDQHLKIANDNFDSDNDDCCHCEANKKQNGSVSRQHPSLKISAQSSKEKPNIIITKTRKGRFAWFWNLFRRKKKKSSSEFSRIRSPTTTKGSSGDTGKYLRPINNNNNNRSPFEPPIYATPSYNLPYSNQRILPLPFRPPPPPRPPPYGIYGSMAARNHPQTIHYTSYISRQLFP